MNTQPRMYVLVRLDLSEKYQCVQGAHALAQYSIDHPKIFSEQWKNQTLLFLGVRNLIELRRWNFELTRKYKMHSIFREPDLDNQETAIACYDTGEIFKELPLA